MTISVRKFEKRFKMIFGDKIWEDFISYKGVVSFQSMNEVVRQLYIYKRKFFEASNLYEKHKPYTRFVLISIERAFRRKSRLIIFDETKKLNGGNFNRSWEVEHIFPQGDFDSDFEGLRNEASRLPKCLNERLSRCCLSCNIDKYLGKHNLNNLTLISRKLNGNEEYKNADFPIKKYIMNCSTENYTEKDFYINRIFKDKKTYEKTAYEIKDYLFLLVNRDIKLKRDFNRIFLTDKFRIIKPDEFGVPIIFFRDVLGYSKSDINSTFHIKPLKRRRLK